MHSGIFESRAPQDESITINAIKDRGTYSLFKRIGVDVVSAGTAALVVSPIMTVIDRAVIEAAAGRASVSESMKASFATLLRHPVVFCNKKPFYLMLLLYSGTYLTSNVADTVSATKHDLAPESVTSSLPKLAAVSGVNVGLSVWKDSQFARIFGVGTAARMPIATYSTFLLRDTLTIFASFNLPSLLAPRLPAAMDPSIGRLQAAQLVCPAVMQWVVTPLHLLGLDLYNRKTRLPFSERYYVVRGAWVSASIARMCRIIPAYGLGGIVNVTTRTYLMKC